MIAQPHRIICHMWSNSVKLCLFFTEEGNWVLFLTEYSAYANTWSVAHNFEHLEKIRKFHDKCFGHLLFDFLECLSSGYEPLELFFLQTIRNWNHNSTESLSWIACRTSPAHENFLLAEYFELRLLDNHLDFLRINWNPLSSYNKPQEYDSVSHEHTLLQICVHLFFPQCMANFLEMTQLQCFNVDQNIIKVDD